MWWKRIIHSYDYYQRPSILQRCATQIISQRGSGPPKMAHEQPISLIIFIAKPHHGRDVEAESTTKGLELERIRKILYISKCPFTCTVMKL